MLKKLNYWSISAGVLGMTAVMLAALATHGIQDPAVSAILERSANYQLLHSLALIVATQLSGRMATLSKMAFFSGIILFCGTIDLKYLTPVAELSRFAPLGGVLLMVGWLTLGLSSMAKYRLK